MGRKSQTYCKRGHEFTEETIYVYNGHRCCKICKAKTAKIRRDLVVGDARAKAFRKSNLRKTGWTIDLFNASMEEQQGLCAICGKVLTLQKRTGGDRACADHEHTAPPKPRGILCGSCNMGLGIFQDSALILENAITYLNKYEKRD